MPKKLLLTTIDNPFNPFTDFDNWNDFDVAHGYHTCSYLARIAKTSIELSDEDNEEAINSAVLEAARLNITGKYKIIEYNG